MFFKIERKNSPKDQSQKHKNTMMQYCALPNFVIKKSLSFGVGILKLIRQTRFAYEWLLSYQIFHSSFTIELYRSRSRGIVYAMSVWGLIILDFMNTDTFKYILHVIFLAIFQLELIILGLWQAFLKGQLLNEIKLLNEI